MSNIARVIHTANRGRVVDVNINNKKFTTPTRAITHTELSSFGQVLEYQKGTRITDVLTPPNAIQETVIDFNDTELKRLVADTPYYRYKRDFLHKKSINANNRVKMCNVMLRGQNQPISDQSILSLATMQIEVDALDTISIPDPNKASTDANPLINALSKAQKLLDDLGEEQRLILPYLDLETSPSGIRNRIEFLLENGYNAIAFRYRPNIPSSYAVAEIVSDKSIWIHLSGVHKRGIGISSIIPQIHIMPFFSFDSISSYKSPFGGGTQSKDSEPFPKVPERSDPDVFSDSIIEIGGGSAGDKKQARFDSAALGYLTRDQHTNLVGNSLNCTCFLCQNLNIEQFFDKYGYINGKYSFPKLRTHLLAHELHASHSELNDCQIAIKESDYARYLWKKPVIQKYNTGVPEIDGQELFD